MTARTPGSLSPHRRQDRLALLVDVGGGRVRTDWLESLADDIGHLVEGGRELLVVSSGAIALGRGVLGLPPGPLRLEESQAAAAVGQIALARAWSETLGRVGITAGQILLTLGDTEERRRYLNARSTIATLLKLRAVPVINENDTVATNEIRYGDNDRLAARVATMTSADLLILLSDVDGLYTASPALDPEARADRDGRAHHARDRGDGRRRGLGKLPRRHEDQARRRQHRHRRRHRHGHRQRPRACTRSAPSRPAAAAPGSLAEDNPVTARKRWISGRLETHGALVVDEGAVKALRAGKSLLPAGVRRIEGRFQRGDAVDIVDLDGEEVGRGLVAYDAADAERIAGRNSHEIEAILGYAGRAEMIHRDDMALRGD